MSHGVPDLDVYLPAIAAGDTAAFARWMATSEGPVRASLTSFAAVVDVEVVVQKTLLRVWQVAPRFAPDGRPHGSLRLAVRIARNLAVSELRRTRATRPAEADELEAALAAAGDPAPAPPDPFLRDAVRACHDKLPERPRQALAARLSAAGGRDDADLADGLGMRLNTFLQNVGRARALLAECLRRAGVALDHLLTEAP